MQITVSGTPDELAAFQKMSQDASPSFIYRINAGEPTELSEQPTTSPHTDEWPRISAADLARCIHDMDTMALIAFLKQRESVRVIKADAGRPYQIVAGDEEKGDIGPATIIVIDEHTSRDEHTSEVPA